MGACRVSEGKCSPGSKQPLTERTREPQTAPAQSQLARVEKRGHTSRRHARQGARQRLPRTARRGCRGGSSAAHLPGERLLLRRLCGAPAAHASAAPPATPAPLELREAHRAAHARRPGARPTGRAESQLQQRPRRSEAFRPLQRPPPLESGGGEGAAHTACPRSTRCCQIAPRAEPLSGGGGQRRVPRTMTDSVPPSTCVCARAPCAEYRAHRLARRSRGGHAREGRLAPHAPPCAPRQGGGGPSRGAAVGVGVGVGRARACLGHALPEPRRQDGAHADRGGRGGVVCYQYRRAAAQQGAAEGRAYSRLQTESSWCCSDTLGAQAHPWCLRAGGSHR